MTKQIIGIGHEARQGKDLVATILNKKIANSKILHFADSLYEECYNVGNEQFPLIYRVSDGFMCKDKDKTYMYLTNHPSNEKVRNAYLKLIKFEIMDGLETYVRMIGKDSKLLQWWGTDYRRNLYGENYWIEQTDERIEKSDEEVIIIPDTRFKNEHGYIKGQDGIYICVKRFDEDGNRIFATDRDLNHISERDLDDVEADINISNDSTVTDLEEQVINLIIK